MNERKLRILFVVRSLDAGGAERQLAVQAEGLSRRGHVVQVATFYPGGPFERSLREAGIEVTSIGKSGRWDVFGFLTRLVRVVRRFDPDVVHPMLTVPNILVTLVKPLLGRARIVWGIRAGEVDWSLLPRMERLTFGVSRVLSRWPDRIIANSHAGAAFHARMGFPPARMRTVVNGIDTERFAPDASDRDTMRRELGIAAGQVVIGIAASLQPLKGHWVLFKAVEGVRRRHGNVLVLAVGDASNGSGEFRRELEDAASGMGIAGNVMWLGRRNDMPRVYRAMDILCSPSFSEGFSNSIGEAMACGVQCVVTDVGDSAFLVGGSGRVVPAGDVEALTTALIAAIEDGIGQNAVPRAQVIEIASVPRMLEATEEALLEVTDE